MSMEARAAGRPWPGAHLTIPPRGCPGLGMQGAGLAGKDRVAIQRQVIEREAQRLREQARQQQGVEAGWLQGQQQAAPALASNPLAVVWDGARNAMERSIDAMLQRTQTLRQGLARLWQGICGTITAEMAKTVAAKVMAFARGRVLALAGIGTDAAKAGAAASQASSPLIGPALALAALATVSGAVLAMGGSIPSAARGWDIPAGVNPIAQLHEREMVLPAGPADVIRDLGEQGGAGQGVRPR
jgi:hypothetical protein